MSDCGEGGCPEEEKELRLYDCYEKTEPEDEVVESCRLLFPVDEPGGGGPSEPDVPGVPGVGVPIDGGPIYPDLPPIYVDMDFLPVVDFGELNFTFVHAVQGNGFNEIIIVGKHKEDINSPEIEVLAKVNYTPATIGGIGELLGIYFMIPLSDLGLTMGQVWEIDGYDPTSSLKTIALILDTGGYDVMWVNPVAFSKINDTRDFAVYDPDYDYGQELYSENAHRNPFFTETTFGRYGGDWNEIPLDGIWGLKYWTVFEDQGADCSSEPDCSNPDSNCSEGWIQDSGTIQVNRLAKSFDQSNGEMVITDIPYAYGEFVGATYEPPSTCAATGTSITNSKAIYVMKEDFALMHDGSVSFSLETSEVTAVAQYKNYQFYNGSHSVNRYQYTKISVPYVLSGLSLYVSGYMIVVGDKYISNRIGSSLKFVTRDGSRTGIVSNIQSGAVVGSVLITVNKQHGTVSQTSLDVL